MLTHDPAGPGTGAAHDALVALLVGVCIGQRQQIERLEAERDELRRRLGLDSRTSSKPPSSDGLARKRRTALSPEPERRRRMGRRPGKQPGAPGRHLAQTATPDHVEELVPALCGHCGEELVENAGVEGMEKRQVADLPRPPGLEWTEYRSLALRCGKCGQVTKAAFPAWAKAPVASGPGLHAMVNYLHVYQHLPPERLRRLLRDVYGAEVSVGSLVQMVARGGERVVPVLEEIKRQLRDAEVVHLDETGAHVGGKVKWVHGAATERLSLLSIDARRGGQGIMASGVTGEFGGIAIHDAWSSYWGKALPKVRGHGLCNAHPLRELAAVTELDGQRWPERMTKSRRRRTRA